ncbi:hypothetical protein [Micromonospora sp. NPDC049645]|uniref:hypothetical protein n=1 Tax=Micromonospora sp. NPDC049645 TaxID=3155508 RepID=UPI00343C679B
MTDPALLNRAARLGAGPLPALFVLDRDRDVTGISGTGVVAAGVIWPHLGGAAYRWCSDNPPPGHDRPVHQIGLFGSAAEVLAVHGHQGATRLYRHDPREQLVDVDLLGTDGVPLVEAFAMTDGRDVTAWGAWWPVDGRAVTYCPPSSPLRRDRGPRTEQISVWRSLDQAEATYAAYPHQCATVRLRSPRGRRLLDAIAALPQSP